MAELPAVKNGRMRLAESGINLEEAQQLRLEFLSGTDMVRICPSFKNLTSIEIGYYGPDGEPLADRPQGAPFKRWRYTSKPTDFSAVVGKPPRYVQLPGTLPVVYFPPCVTNWPEICAEPERFPLIITEGEFKAAKACLMGFPTIGLGGVYNWRALKMGVPWIPSLDLIDWRRRRVFLAWDSDWRFNTMVCVSLIDFSDQLERRGTINFALGLPTYEEGQKVGLDDFLVHEGAGASEALLRLLQEAEPIGLGRPLWAMNTRFLYAENPGMVVDTRTGQRIAPAAFRDHHQATAQYPERKLQKNGNITYHMVSAAGHWLKWPMRRQVNRLTYLPGRETYPVIDGLPCYNTWKGLAVEPVEGDVTPFLTLVNHLFHGHSPEEVRWFLSWLAYPLQNPGVKLSQAVLLHGPRHGTGKSLIGYTMKEIYGTNFGEIGTMELHSSFNEWAEGKQFIMGDDIMGGDQRKFGDYLKNLITRPETRINVKFVATYTVPDFNQFYFTSNHADALLLEDDDRRLAVYLVSVGPLEPQFYADYVKCLRQEDGAAKILNFLLEYDCGDFNPGAPAIRTVARELMIEANKSDAGMWVKRLLDAPDAVLRQGEMIITKDLFTSRELLALYDPTGHTRVTANGIGRELAKLGVRHVYGGKPIKLPSGEQARYFAIRNYDKWVDAGPKEIVDHLVTWMARQGERQRKY